MYSPELFEMVSPALHAKRIAHAERRRLASEPISDESVALPSLATGSPVAFRPSSIAPARLRFFEPRPSTGWSELRNSTNPHGRRTVAPGWTSLRLEEFSMVRSIVSVLLASLGVLANLALFTSSAHAAMNHNETFLRDWE
jgi:hypothetical protein